MMYFFLNPHVFIVNGASKSALYDIENGGIFQISNKLKLILEKLDNKEKVKSLPNHELVLVQLKELEKLDLGSFSQEPKCPIKITIEPPKPKLNILWLSLNSNCNLFCEHCYATSEPGPYDGSIPLEKLFDTLEEAKNVFDLECVQLIGGEPLLLGKEKISKILEKAFNLNIPTIEIFTNAHLIDEYYINLFNKFNVNVAISIYSNIPEDHDKVTKRKGSWQKTVRAIHKVKEAGLALRFGVVAMEQNKNTVGETAQWLKDTLQIDQTSKPYDVVRGCGRGNRNDVIPWDMFMHQHMRLEPDFAPVSYSSLQKTIYGNVCWANEACIMPNGDVTPCEMEFNVIQGNIKSQSLTDILLGSGGDFGQRLTKDKIEICKDCEFRYACWECRAMAHQLDINKYSKPLTCMYNPHQGIWESPPKVIQEYFPRINTKSCPK